MKIDSSTSYQVSPAPWQLKGDGYLFLYWFGKDFLKQEAFIAQELKQKQQLNMGMVMLVNYRDSPVGTYGELLFIPGRFAINGTNYWHISKIYVSSVDSVMNGRANWGIPKELARFDFGSMSKGEHSVKVHSNGQLIFGCNCKDWGLGFPLSTQLMPFEFYQPLEGKEYLTKPNGSGKAHFTTVNHLETGKGLFPNINTQSRLASLHIPHFNLNFPIPNFL